MSATTKKKSALKRKTEKQYTRVQFTLDFIEGTFDIPSFKQVPVGVQRKTMKGDLDPLVDFLKKTSGEEVKDIFDDLDEDESGDFLDAWAEASGVNLGK